MSPRELVGGNEAVAEAAIKAGCRFFCGYPITPQTEILEHMARRLPQIGGFFLQAESEVAAISVVMGVACTGARVMTATSSPGMSLMQEGISYLASMELPCVIVDVMRASPGLGRIPPAQSDYFQATKKGHGDFNLIVLAPSSVQELSDLVTLAFDLADQYRNPVTILLDGMLGEMMETMSWSEKRPQNYPKEWVLSGAEGRKERLIISAPLTDPEIITLNIQLANKYKKMAANECRWEEFDLADSEVVLVAFGTTSRICLEAVNEARQSGIKAGLIRPVTLWPFPDKPFQESCPRARAFLSVEMNNGQMLEDVKLAVNGKAPVHFFGQGGGWMPSSLAVKEQIEKLVVQS
jgi:2-oxoglutarate ferredoxin oxidoreductase subunit alpha